MSKEEMSIEELQRQLEQGLTIPSALQPLIPPGFRPHITLHGPERKMKRNASAKNWSPESGEIHIRFERTPTVSTSHLVANPSGLSTIDNESVRRFCTACYVETEETSCPRCGKPTTLSTDIKRFPREAAEDNRRAGIGPLEKPATPVSDPLADLVRSLDRAESRPGFDFVALKWFRDVALPEEGFAWTQSDTARHNALRDAIEKRLILTGRIPNPRSPQFPVTSIRLNRLLPEVQAILGKSGLGGEDFEPVEIRGESLSATILRERR